MKKIWFLLALALVVATGAYGTTLASANHGHGTNHGTVTATDTTADTITLTTFRKCDSLTIDLGTNTKIFVNHAKATLADIQPGMAAVVKLARDGTAKNIHARTMHPHNILHGTATSFDTNADTLTITLNKTCASVDIQLTSDTKIQVNDQTGALSDIGNGYRVLAKLNKDDSARWIHARAPKS